jgi:hypothetical protein
MNAQVKVWQLLSAAAAFIIAIGTLIFHTGATLARTDVRVTNLENRTQTMEVNYRIDMRELNIKQDQIIKTQNDILILLQNKQDRK